MILRQNRVAGRWLGPPTVAPRALWMGGQSGCLLDFSLAEGLWGATGPITPGASLVAALDRKAGMPTFGAAFDDIDFAAGWTLVSASGGAGSITTTTFGGAWRNLMVVGKTYRVRATISVSAGNVTVVNGTGATPVLVPWASAIDIDLIWVASATALYIRCSEAATITVQSLVVEEALGVSSIQTQPAARGLWQSDALGGYWLPDLADDAISFTLPAAVDGEVFIIGRAGSWREARAAALGATVTIGGSGAGTLGTPGILRATGGVIACGFRSGTMTDAEWRRLIRAWRSRGALGNLALGAEMLTNGGFDTDLTGWPLLLGTVAWEAGGVRCTSDGTQFGRIGQSVTGSLTGKQFLVGGQCVSVSGWASNGYLFLSTGVESIATINVQPGAPVRRCYTFPTDATYMYALPPTTTAGHSVLFDNLSIKPLIVEAL